MQRITQQLRYPTDYIDPFMMRDLSGVYSTTVVHPDYVEVGKNRLMSIDPPLKVGEAVRLFARSKYIELEYESDYQDWRAAIAREQAEKEAFQQQQADQFTARHIEASKVYFTSYNIPFRFTIEVKEVLSGLSANSNGNGQKRNTVLHVYLQEAFRQGRFNRKAGDFLCSQSQAQRGGNWSDSLGKGTFKLDKDGTQPVPTCKQCRAALERFKKS